MLTEAELVPPPQDETVPDRPEERNLDSKEGKVDPEVLHDLKRLAERVGGLERLKEVVEILIRLPR